MDASLVLLRKCRSVVVILLAVAGVVVSADASEVTVPVNIIQCAAAVFVPVESTVMVVVVSIMVLVDAVVIVDVDGTVTGSRS